MRSFVQLGRLNGFWTILIEACLTRKKGMVTLWDVLMVVHCHLNLENIRKELVKRLIHRT